MRIKMNASSQMPKYIYMPLPDGTADVFIYKFVSEDEEGYTYETNEFRTSVLAEKDIAVNPYFYLDYEEHEKDLDEKIAELEAQNEMLTECLMELADIIYA